MKKRLNNNHREALRELAHRVVDTPVETKVFNDAYARAEVLGRAVIEKQYPPEDMKLLRKYEVAEQETSVRFHYGENLIIKFEFNEGSGPHSPLGAGNHYVVASRTTFEAFEKCEAARKALVEARKTKLAMYDAVIDGATTWTDIINAWPEAAEVAERHQAGELIAVNPDVIEFVRSDSARRRQQSECRRG